jgi:cytochrome P450
MSLEAIPESPTLPLVGGTAFYLKDALAYLEAASRCGDIVKVRVFGKTAWLLNDPALIDQVLVKSAPFYQKDMFLRSLKQLLGEGLLSSSGDFWKRQRRLIQPAFHRDKIAGYAEIMTGHTVRAISKWHDGQSLDVHQEMMQLTAEIVTECLFGTSAGDESEVAAAIDVAMDRFANPFFLAIPKLGDLPLPVNRRFREVVPRLDRIVRGFIEARRAMGTSHGKHDLLSMLLDARDEDGSSMSDQQVRDEVLILFLAGHETTALALSWTLHELALNPGVERRLHDELARVLGNRPPTFADLPKLEYAARVVNESLRLHPPAWSLGREAIEAVELGGHTFEPGAWFWMLPWTLQRDPRWFSDPLAFRPERWVEGFQKALPKFAYMPFGGGPRICIGNQFALMEAVLLLATIAQRYWLRGEPGHPVVPEPAITLRFKHGLRMTATKRDPS